MERGKKQLIEDGTRKRQRDSRLSMSEIMTIVIGFHMSHHRDFKNYYQGYIRQFYRQAFPTLLSYTRILEVMPRTICPYVCVLYVAKRYHGLVLWF